VMRYSFAACCNASVCVQRRASIVVLISHNTTAASTAAPTFCYTVQLLQQGGKFVAAISSLLKWLRTCKHAGYFWSPVTAADFRQQPSEWNRYCTVVPEDFRIDLGAITANFERGEYGAQRGTGQHHYIAAAGVVIEYC
jgi:hypothetical protein